MRKAFILVAVLFQFIVLAYMAGGREFIVRHGKTVFLRTAPIDPRDLFRGDYVRLNYEVSNIPAKYLRGRLKTDLKDMNDKVYAILAEGPNGVAELRYATDEKPNEGLYIGGRLPGRRRSRTFNQAIHAKYGIEAYFVQQGRGRDLEKRLGSRTGLQIPLEMEIAVGLGGTAVIKGHRWSPLGIGLQSLETRRWQPTMTRRSARFRLTLVNASNLPLALVTLPDHGSFYLEPVGRKDWVLAQVVDDRPKPTDDDIIVLGPSEKETFDFDFSRERWFVTEGEGEAREIGILARSERFRIVYRPPSSEDCRSLEKRDLVWHGNLPSRAFHGLGDID